MAHVSKNILTAPGKYSSNIEKCLDGCKEKFNQILSGVLNGGNQDAHKMEASIFNQLIKLGFILMQLYFASQNRSSDNLPISNIQPYSLTVAILI
jgi:hypothetical protein